LGGAFKDARKRKEREERSANQTIPKTVKKNETKGARKSRHQKVKPKRSKRRPEKSFPPTLKGDGMGERKKKPF